MEQAKLTTRKEQLLYIYKNRFFDIVLASVFSFIFLIPFLLFKLFVASTFLQEENLYNELLTSLISIICLMIFSLSQAGCYYFFKKMIYGEGASFRNDFFTGIKKNYRPFLLYYGVFGIIYYAIHLFNFICTTSSIFVYPTSVIILGCSYGVLFIYIILGFFIKTQVITYLNNFSNLIKNSISFFIGKFFSNLLILLITCLPFCLIEFSSNEIVLYVVLVLLAIFYFGSNSLLISSYCIDIYDHTINKNFLELLKKGLDHE
jgi:hypothetical protein